jgi:CPA2 family monovalent cation:H+ antiporter-2
VPIADNPDYIARARQLNSDLETALAARAQNQETEEKERLLPRRPGDTSSGGNS